MSDKLSKSAPKHLPQEELQKEYLKQFEELEDNSLVDGVVVQVTNDTVFIDVGAKAEGKISITEFDEIPKVNDVVQVVLVQMHGRNGDVRVSKRKADEKAAWRDVKAAFAEGLPVKGKVAKSIKGGFEVSLGPGIRAFNPISKIDTMRVENPEEYIDMEAMFSIERLYHENKLNPIVSRRAYLEKETEENRANFFAERAVGDVVKGKVKSFTSFGAFIDLGGFDGLLHNNDMSWGHVSKPKDFVGKDQEIELKIIKLDTENQKINLSLKEMTANPWDDFHIRYNLDDTIKGKVTKLTDFGAFIELEPGIEGLVHISELSWVKRIKHPKELLHIGDEVEAKVLGFDIEARKVSLGMKQVMANPWDEMEEKYPVGYRFKGPIRKVTATGAFVEIEEGIDGFLHIDDFSWTKKIKNPSSVLKEGEEIEVMVLSISGQNRNIRVGVKQLEEDPWKSLKSAFPEGSIITGEVTNVNEYGIFVRVQGGIEGLISKGQLSDPREVKPEEVMEKYSVGDEIRCVVYEMQPSRNRLTLSLRELKRQEERKEYEKYLHETEDESDSSTVTLGDLLNKEKED